MPSHTINGQVVADVRCEGRSPGEIGLNAALAAHMGSVPVLFVGDDPVAVEAADVVPGIHTVVVRHALGSAAARGLHPAEASQRIEDAVGGALDARAQMQPLRFDGSVKVEVDVFGPRMLANVLLVPGVQRTAACTVAYDADDYLAACKMVRLVALLGST